MSRTVQVPGVAVPLIGQPTKEQIADMQNRVKVAEMAACIASAPLALAMQAAMIEQQHEDNPLGLAEKDPLPEKIAVNTDMVAQVSVDTALRILGKLGLNL